MQVVASDDDDEEIDMAGTELLDNLTFITSKGVMGGVEGKQDWVTGIQGESWGVEELRAGETVQCSSAGPSQDRVPQRQRD